MRIRRSILLLAVGLLLGVLLPPTARAQYFGRNKVQYQRFDFRTLKTPHFDIYFYPAERDATEDAARMAERWNVRLESVFRHPLQQRKPVILYADDADFQQTNVIQGFIGAGTGGVTEALRNRLVMPLTGAYHDTDHVLGHEMVHEFQYDIWQSSPDSLAFDINGLPLWFIEGMAEYLSLGRRDPLTAMWMRDAAMRDEIPTIDALTKGPEKYFPYRYGQALWAYLGGRWGDEVVGRLYAAAGRRGVDSAFVDVLGETTEQLSRDWAAALRTAYGPMVAGRTKPEDAGARVLSKDKTGGHLHLAPAVSPDNRYVAFLSERGLFSIDLYLADARTGRVLKTLTHSGTDAHFDALRFINSAGAWSPDGRRLAFVTFADGTNRIAVLNVADGTIERQYAAPGTGAISNPAWGPDGRRIAFSGITGGISDLYVLDLDTGGVRRLTDDKYADLQPAWSPDGRTLAFVTDRGAGTDFDRLQTRPMQIGLLDMASGTSRLLPLFGNGRHINPQYAPGGRDLYFVADPDGFNDLYRYSFDDETIYRVTRLATGVSGITSLSPAMSVAQQGGRVVFSVFEGGDYNVYALPAEQTQGVPVSDGAPSVDGGVLPPVSSRIPGLVSAYLASPSGLPEERTFPIESYHASLHLDYLSAEGGVGFGVNRFGTVLGGGIGMVFSDMFGDHNLGFVVQANGTMKDIGGQVMYQNLKHRWNWGASLGHVPYLTTFTQARLDTVQVNGQGYIGTRYEQIVQRTFYDQASLLFAYPLSTNRRVEANAGYTHLGYNFEIESLQAVGSQIIDRSKRDLAAPAGLNLVDASVAYVGDYSFFGFTSPVQGRRYRFELEGRTGSLTYGGLLLDYRRYFFLRPFTLALRGLHYGRYGADAESDRLTPLFLGYGTLVRGYDYYSFDLGECADGQGLTDRCPVFDRLTGSRIAVANLELRFPLLGNREFGLINFPYLPTELAAFFDAGTAWTSKEPPVFKLARRSAERVPVFSTGLSTRVNVLGALVLEFDYVLPFQRPDKGWHLGFEIAPGW